jgi:hypothetical protein
VRVYASFSHCEETLSSGSPSILCPQNLPVKMSGGILDGH